ncbi:hypothetical protein MGMO_105c00030 [Methyloglobulus morosus KoM1]|uniref:Metal-binding protein n=1 Tax=Methyloglobulus morosus KoM1 TaxID=1116472 RepID=V5DVB7_9GAMM|nr:DUF411 domain-containing protein [Methyloglobulus morosus]ESS71351.1 hypothetical protein MGMO_105c00030 [Methyloglobulus morosus KoM1]
MKAKQFLTIALLVNTGFIFAESKQTEKSVDIVVNRSPTCSCCGKWVEHLEQNNFNVKDIVSGDVQAIKNKYGITQDLASCHTAIVDGYVVEGHVPASDIRTLLKNKPDIVGLTVPGMPNGTPGMEMGGKKDAYEVIGFDKKNQHHVFNSYQAE